MISLNGVQAHLRRLPQLNIDLVVVDVREGHVLLPVHLLLEEVAERVERHHLLHLPLSDFSPEFVTLFVDVNEGLSRS